MTKRTIQIEVSESINLSELRDAVIRDLINANRLDQSELLLVFKIFDQLKGSPDTSPTLTNP